MDKSIFSSFTGYFNYNYYQTRKWGMLVTVIMVWGLLSCGMVNDPEAAGKELFDNDNLVAWCIVPFDAMERSPKERAAMLEDLGFTKMAWDWRMEHIETLPEEIESLQGRGIELAAVWLWLDRHASQGLQPHHHQIFDAVGESGLETTYWVSFGNDFFEGLTCDEKVENAANAISLVHDRVRGDRGRIALYNHMDWFGEPENQICIIEKLGRDSIGIVYNFHHAHHQVEDFPRLLEMMMPYLYTVNLNGMRMDGPKILDLGSGDLEAGMIRTLAESGFKGTIGILGHTEGEDIEKVLLRNLVGLERIREQL